MPAITVRNLPEDVHRALKVRAAKHGCSTEAEVREILRQAVAVRTDARIGSELAAFGREHGGLEIDVPRRREPAEAAAFE